MKKTLLVLTILSLAGNYSYCQSLDVLKKIDNKYQDCLDNSNNMALCSQKYYYQMDSLLNVVYKSYRATLTNAQKQSLKSEQLNWLTLRDNYFKKIDKENSGDPKFKDARMIAFDEKSQFVRERVIYFIKK